MVITKYIKPRNPQFFQPILPGSFQQLVIPSGFLKKYLRRDKCEKGKAVLRNSGKSWHVNVNGFCFKEGWSDFVGDLHLHIGDFMVFRHQGGMVFDVLVFDRSACEKEYPPLHAKNKNKREEKVENRGKEANFEKKTRNFKGSVRTRLGPLKAAREYAASCKFTKPFFVVTIGKSNLTKHTLNIPRDFASSNGLMGKSFEVILKDQEGRYWSVQLRHKSDGQVYLGGGWHEFAVANHLKEQHLCIFKLICSANIHEDGNMVFDVTVMDSKASRRKSAPADVVVDSKASGRKSPLADVNKDSHIECNKPSFATSLKKMSLVHSLLCVPREFARSNDLIEKMNHEITLNDKKGRTWELKLKLRKKIDICLRSDWPQISAANGLKEGDTVNLQFTREDDEMQTMEFRLL